MIWINIKLALASLRSSKLRAFLTMFAVIIGVAAFVLITTTVEGLKSNVSSEIDELGGNLIAVVPGDVITRDDSGEVTNVNFAGSFGASTLSQRDLEDIRQTEGVEAAAPQMIVSGTVARKGQKLEGGLIIATNEDYPKAFAQNVEIGTFFEGVTDATKFVVVGSGVVDELYGGEAALGSKLTVRGEEFTLLGVMEEFSAGGINFGFDLNRAVFLPLETGIKFNGGASLIQEIDAQVSDGYDIEQVAAEIDKTILANHGGERDFSVIKQEELIDVTNGVLDIVKSASQAISSVMLFVGAIVILLIMMITVSERTREIGIRKSIGATNANILTQFITEAIIISWFGSLIGLVVAWLLGLVVAATADITPVYSLNTMLLVVAIATVIGGIAGIYPAWQAARKDPVEALRHE